MTYRKYVRIFLILAFFLVSFFGLVMHLRVHPPENDITDLVPFITSVIGVAGITTLFCFRSTLPYAYVLNGMLVIIGTVTMAHYSIAKAPETFTPGSVIMKTLLPEILLLWGNFAVGESIFRLNMIRTGEETIRKVRVYRYPNIGWWLVHLVSIAVVYYLGHVLWP